MSNYKLTPEYLYEHTNKGLDIILLRNIIIIELLIIIVVLLLYFNFLCNILQLDAFIFFYIFQLFKKV